MSLDPPQIPCPAWQRMRRHRTATANPSLIWRAKIPERQRDGIKFKPRPQPNGHDDNSPSGQDADGLFGPYGRSAPWINSLAHNNGDHGRHERAHPIGFVGRFGISIPGYPATQGCAQPILEISSRSEWLWMERCVVQASTTLHGGC